MNIQHQLHPGTSWREMVFIVNPITPIFILIGAYIVYQLAKALLNISPFHPLNHIPGPRLASATYLPEFYHDAIRHGRYTERIRNMHDQYGPIVRISPNEVHCNDIRFVDEIYAVGGRKRDKPVHQVRGAGSVALAIFATVDHDVHRVRRSALAKFFARSQVSKLEPKIHGFVRQFCDKMLAARDAPFDVTAAFSCFSTDVITGYCFGESYGFLTQRDWEPNFRKPLYALLKPLFWFRFFPFLMPLSVAMSKFTKNLSDDLALLVKTVTVDVPDKIEKTRADISAGYRDKEETVFGSLLESTLSADEKSVERLTSEATALLSAGTETVSWAMSVITFHLLTNPSMLERLTDEVATVFDKSSDRSPSWQALERLPYLSGVIYEGLRLSYGVASRTARIATEEDLVYRGSWAPKGSSTPVDVEYVIPRGYAIGMSSAIAHHDESRFPDSHRFTPERWMDETQTHRRKDLDRSLLSFSKGSRACIGMNLAFCELYLSLAAMTMWVYPHMRLYETTQRDIEYDHDMFNPMPVKESKGVRVVII